MLDRAMTSLAEAWDEAVMDLPIDSTAEQVAMARRLFYRGALTAAGMPREQLLAELVAYGRAIGTPAERATV